MGHDTHVRRTRKKCQRRGSGSTLEAVCDDAPYKSTFFYVYFTLEFDAIRQHRQMGRVGGIYLTSTAVLNYFDTSCREWTLSSIDCVDQSETISVLFFSV